MRHGVSGKKLGRNTKSRHALLDNLATSMFLHGQVKTTLAKAKFVKSHVEKVITKAKKNRLGSKRVIASHLPTNAFARLLNEIVPTFENRDGGYTRIIKLSPRSGDNAPMARLEFVELIKPQGKQEKETKLKKKQPKKEVTKLSAKKAKIQKKTVVTKNSKRLAKK